MLSPQKSLLKKKFVKKIVTPTPGPPPPHQYDTISLKSLQSLHFKKRLRNVLHTHLDEHFSTSMLTYTNKFNKKKKVCQKNYHPRPSATILTKV